MGKANYQIIYLTKVEDLDNIEMLARRAISVLDVANGYGFQGLTPDIQAELMKRMPNLMLDINAKVNELRMEQQ